MNWALATPQYHFGMAVIAILALGYSITIHRKLKLEHKVVVALCKLLGNEIVMGRRKRKQLMQHMPRPKGKHFITISADNNSAGQDRR